jgi:hypothetical protein
VVLPLFDGTWRDPIRVSADTMRTNCVVERLQQRHLGRGFRQKEPRATGIDRLEGYREVLAYAAAHQLIIVSHDANTMPANAYTCIRAGTPLVGLLMVKQSDPVGIVIDDLMLI